MRRVAAGIAYRAVRNRGTIGGSSRHADPAADWVSALPALGAQICLRSPAGHRDLAIEDFMTGALESALLAGRTRRGRPRSRSCGASARWGYCQSLPQARRICARHCRRADRSGRGVGARSDRRDRSAHRSFWRDASPLFGGKITGNFKRQFDRTCGRRSPDQGRHRDTLPTGTSTLRCCAGRSTRRARMTTIGAHRQRRAVNGRGRAAHPSGGFPARPARPDRNASRLRTRRVRRVHAAARRHAGALVHHFCGGLRRSARHHDRRPRRRRDRNRAARRVQPRARASVRLLHAGHADLGARSRAASRDLR